jgi:hypothetical protein
LATVFATGFAAAARVAGLAAVFGADDAAGLRGVVMLLFCGSLGKKSLPFCQSYLGKQALPKL